MVAHNEQDDRGGPDKRKGEKEEKSSLEKRWHQLTSSLRQGEGKENVRSFRKGVGMARATPGRKNHTGLPSRKQKEGGGLKERNLRDRNGVDSHWTSKKGSKTNHKEWGGRVEIVHIGEKKIKFYYYLEKRRGAWSVKDRIARLVRRRNMVVFVPEGLACRENMLLTGEGWREILGANERRDTPTQ